MNLYVYRMITDLAHEDHARDRSHSRSGGLEMRRLYYLKLSDQWKPYGEECRSNFDVLPWNLYPQQIKQESRDCWSWFRHLLLFCAWNRWCNLDRDWFNWLSRAWSSWNTLVQAFSACQWLESHPVPCHAPLLPTCNMVGKGGLSSQAHKLPVVSPLNVWGVSLGSSDLALFLLVATGNAFCIRSSKSPRCR